MRLSAAAAAAILFAALPAAAQTGPAPGGAAQPTPTPAPAANAAAAEATKGMDQLMKYVGTETYFKSVSTVVLGGEHDIEPQCQAKVLGRAGMTVLALPEFESGKDTPSAGAWKDQILVDRCGTRVIHNALIEVEKDGPHIGLMLPGETGAPQGLQPAILQEVALTSLKATGCKDPNTFVILDTRKHKLLAEMKADDLGRLAAGKWDELWTTRACGKVKPVMVTFTADGKGSVTYSAKVTSAK